MKKIEQFNRVTLKDLREQLTTTLNDFGEQFGISIEVGGIRFEEHNATIKLTSTIAGQLNSKEQSLDHYTDYKVGDVIDYPSSTLSGKIIVKGYNPKARKYPLIIKNNGKSYKIRYSRTNPYSVIS